MLKGMLNHIETQYEYVGCQKVVLAISIELLKLVSGKCHVEGYVVEIKIPYMRSISTSTITTAVSICWGEPGGRG